MFNVVNGPAPCRPVFIFVPKLYFAKLLNYSTLWQRYAAQRLRDDYFTTIGYVSMKLKIFKRQLDIEESIDNFLNTLSESGILFHENVKAYIIKSKSEFDTKSQMIIKHEHEADKLRRDIETQIYRKNLIPESSGDILALMEKLDNIINKIGFATNRFDIEAPVIPDELYHQFERIAYTSMQAVEALVLSTRSFFKNIPMTQDNLHKVSFWEGEGDKAILHLQKVIFQSELDLAHKLHLRSLANDINAVSDMSEDAADMLHIFVIKNTY